MCGKPKTVYQDPEGDAQRAAEKATAEANTKKSMRRSAIGSGSSVLSGSDQNQKQLSGFAKNFNNFVQEKKSTLGGG